MRYVELDTLTRWLLVNLIDLYIFYSKVVFLIFLHFRVSFGVQIIYIYISNGLLEGVVAFGHILLRLAYMDFLDPPLYIFPRACIRATFADDQITVCHC